MKKSVDLIYFSWTGNTRKVFEFLQDELERRGFVTNLKEIKPKRDYPYAFWLIFSFIPNLAVEINSVEISSKVIFLGMPKWTFNCPPITAFLKKADLRGKTVFLVITYGGFDEKRYAKSMAEKIKKSGFVPKILLIKRKKIESNEYKAIVSEWINEIEDFGL